MNGTLDRNAGKRVVQHNHEHGRHRVLLIVRHDLVLIIIENAVCTVAYLEQL